MVGKEKPGAVTEGPSTAVVDGRNGLGAVASQFAMQACLTTEGEVLIQNKKLVKIQSIGNTTKFFWMRLQIVL
jgi:hypothetical protein